MKVVLGLILLAPVAASADRLFELPTASKVRTGEWQFRHRAEQGRLGRGSTGLATGMGEAVDLELIYLNARKPAGTLDLSYNLVPALADNLPGLSIGVQDAFARTAEGRGMYFVMTFKYNQFGTYNSNTPAEISIGAGGGRFKGVFFSAMLPLADQLRLVAEHDSRRLTAGLALQPRTDLKLHWMFRRDATLLGADYSYKF